MLTSTKFCLFFYIEKKKSQFMTIIARNMLKYCIPIKYKFHAILKHIETIMIMNKFSMNRFYMLSKSEINFLLLVKSKKIRKRKLFQTNKPYRYIFQLEELLAG